LFSKLQRKSPDESGLKVLAEWTGLEPATPGVTGRYSNQLNYHSLIGFDLGIKLNRYALVGAKRLELLTYAL
jgi:hypothetical protein